MHFRSSRAGFTLVELLIVVAIVAVVAMLAVPGLSRALQDRRAGQAAVDVVRLARRARAEAAAYGRAYVIRYDQDDDEGRGRMVLWRGLNNGCNTNEWTAIIGTCVDNPFCVDAVSMSQSEYSLASFTVGLELGGELGTSVDICYRPSGTMMWRAPAASGTFTDQNTDDLAGAFLFRVEPRGGDGALRGVVRRVVLPLGGGARVLR